MPFGHFEDEQRDAEQRAREAEQRGRDAEQRHRDREKEREKRHQDRERLRAEHRARHEARKMLRFGRRGLDINVDIDPDEIARSVGAAFVGIDDDDGESYEETVEKTFTVTAMPRLRVRNVSGETNVHVGEAGVVQIVAVKRVHGRSADRAKRLLENVEVRMEQKGDDIYVEPHLYEQERGWLDLFRGKRFRVDFDITVPRECAVDAQTVSGDLEVKGTRGPARAETVSGDVRLTDVQGPLRIKSVSGDVECADYVGVVEGGSVSGDIDIRGRVRAAEFQTVSGDVTVDLDLQAGGRETRLKTISGDVELGLISSSCLCEFHTASGHLECETPANVIREGRKDRTIVIGEARTRVYVKTVSGDLTIRRASSAVMEEPVTTPVEEREPTVDETTDADPEGTAPMTPPPAAARVRGLLERLARGELSVDEAAAQLDDSRRGG